MIKIRNLSYDIAILIWILFWLIDYSLRVQQGLIDATKAVKIILLFTYSIKGDDSESGGLLPAQIDVMAEGKMLALHLVEDRNQTNIIQPPDHVDDKPDTGAKVIVKQEPGHSVQLDKLSAIDDMSGTDQHRTVS